LKGKAMQVLPFLLTLMLKLVAVVLVGVGVFKDVQTTAEDHHDAMEARCRAYFNENVLSNQETVVFSTVKPDQLPSS